MFRAIAVALLTVTIAASAATGAIIVNEDTSSDSGTAMDILKGSVGESGPARVTFNVQFSAPPQDAQDRMLVLVDTDLNPVDGPPQSRGAEYMAVLTPSLGNVPAAARLYHWRDGRWQLVSTPTARLSAEAAAHFEYTLDRTDLGGAKSFNYWYRSIRGGSGLDNLLDDEAYQGRFDDGPDYGLWIYVGPAPPTVKLSARAAVTTPKKPVAGRLFKISVLFARSDGKPVGTTSSATSVVRVAGVRVGRTYALVGNRLVIRTVIPKGARGKRLALAITIRSGGAVLAKTLSFAIG